MHNDFLTRCNELADTLERKTTQQQTQIERLTAVNRQLNEHSSSLQRQVEALESENKQLAATNSKLTSLLRSAKKKLGL